MNLLDLRELCPVFMTIQVITGSGFLKLCSQYSSYGCDVGIRCRREINLPSVKAEGREFSFKYSIAVPAIKVEEVFREVEFNLIIS